jgi:hypothetical protein
VEVINSKVDILLQGTDGGGCCPTEITAAGLAPTPTIITGSFLITSSGTYCLARNAVAPSNQISTSNVVLDLGGHTLYGTININNNNSTMGQNITIKNGTIIPDKLGILLGGNTSPMANITIDNITFIDNGTCIIANNISQLKGLNITNCRFINYNLAAISTDTSFSQNVHVENCIFNRTRTNPGGIGIQLETTTEFSLKNNIIEGTGAGIVIRNCNHGLIQHCDVIGSSNNSGAAGEESGIILNLSPYQGLACTDIVIDHCKSLFHTSGFDLASTYSFTIENCIAENNETGFTIRTVAGDITASNGLIQGCRAVNNRLIGFSAGTGNTVTYASNIARGNGVNNYSPAGSPFNPVSLTDAPTYWQNAVT